MQSFERADFGLDMEQRCDEVLEMRPQRNQQFRFGFERERLRVASRRLQTIRERRIGVKQMPDKCVIDARSAVVCVKIGKRKAVGKVDGVRSHGKMCNFTFRGLSMSGALVPSK